jgi:hypothetical protein
LTYGTALGIVVVAVPAVGFVDGWGSSLGVSDWVSNRAGDRVGDSESGQGEKKGGGGELHT